MELISAFKILLRTDRRTYGLGWVFSLLRKKSKAEIFLTDNARRPEVRSQEARPEFRRVIHEGIVFEKELITDQGLRRVRSNTSDERR